MIRVLALFAALLTALPAQAQNDNRRWEVEFHLGALTGTDPISGSGRLPDPLPAAPLGFPISGMTSAPVVTSWFFGEGARLMQVMGAFLVRGATPFVPLDAVLTRGDARYETGMSAGARLGARFGGRWRAELAVDYGASRLQIADDALQQFEASRSTFAEVFNRSLLFLGAQSASATMSADNGDARAVVTMASIARDLPGARGVVPYLRAGAGVTSTIGQEPTVQLEGEYTFRFMGGVSPTPLTQRDAVSVRYRQSQHTFTWSAGGGARIDVSPRWLVRVDASVVVSRPESQITVAAANSSQPLPSAQSGSATILGTTPPIVFSTFTSARSTLSGPPLQDFVTFSGKSTQTRLNVTAGLGFRF